MRRGMLGAGGLSHPMAVEYTSATVMWPIAVPPFPVATQPSPIAVLYCPAAVQLNPSAVDAAEVAWQPWQSRVHATGIGGGGGGPCALASAASDSDRAAWAGPTAITAQREGMRRVL